MSVSLDIIDESGDWESLADRARIAEEIVQTSARLCGVDIIDGAEVSLMFCDDARIRELNHDWRNIDKPTNVLSFPATAQGGLRLMLGDIAIAFETVQLEAADEGKSIADHTAHLIAHGFLHLVGFDHVEEQDALVMENKEREILAAHGIADPYSADSPAHISP